MAAVLTLEDVRKKIENALSGEHFLLAPNQPSTGGSTAAFRYLLTPRSSMDLAAKKNCIENLLLGSGVMADGARPTFTEVAGGDLIGRLNVRAAGMVLLRLSFSDGAPSPTAAAAAAKR